LASDAKVDLTAIFEGVSSKNFKDKKPGIVAELKKVKLAKDASIGDVAEMLDMLDSHHVEEGADADPNSALPMSAEEMEKKKAEDAMKRAHDAHEFLKGKLSAEDMATYDSMCGEDDAGGEAEDEESKRAEENSEGEEGGGGEDGKHAKDRKHGKDAEMVSKKAMDAAIAKAVEGATKQATTNALKLANDIAAAKEDVAPWVGKLAMDAKSPEDVYQAALGALGVEVKDVHPSAFKAVLKAQPKPGSATKLAADAAVTERTSGTDSRWGKTLDRISLAG